MIKGIWKKLLWSVIILALLLFLGSGCAKEKLVVLPDSELITDHPTDDGKVCLDKGYLLRIYDELEVCK